MSNYKDKLKTIVVQKSIPSTKDEDMRITKVRDPLSKEMDSLQM